MAAHSPECEDADPGSLCDCDCAGSRHAIRRTVGNVAAAGQVSKRAQLVAHRDGRAPVVNTRAVPNGRPAVAKPGKAPVVDAGKARNLPDRPVAPVQTTSRPPRLSPTTKAALDKARASLPKDKAGWQAAAVEASQELTDAHARHVARRQAEHDDAVKALADYDEQTKYGEFAKRVMKEAKGRPGFAQYKGLSDPQLRKDVDLIFTNGIYNHPDLLAQRDNLRGNVYDAQRNLDQAQRDAKAAEAGMYPMDKTTGLRMPTAALQQHLATVRTAGRAALADAKAEWERDPPPAVLAAQQAIAGHATAKAALAALTLRQGRAAAITADGMGRFGVPLPDGLVTIKTKAQFDDLKNQYARQLLSYGGVDKLHEHRQTIAGHQAGVLRKMLGEHRKFGGRRHTAMPARDTFTEQHDSKDRRGVTNPRADWKERLAVAEDHFPADWVKTSSLQPIKVGASRRAYYGGSATGDLLSMRSEAFDDVKIDGALSYVDEVNVHELGHRMERMIPGLTHLEFAYVRERGREADGSVQRYKPIAGYEDTTEVSQEDKWGNPYVGKTYEARDPAAPGELSWEVFQTGLQDTFGRSSSVMGPTDDPEELQAFVIGALLTLG